MSRSPNAVDCRRRAPHRRASAGFSLVELMTVIIILGILAAFAAPSVRSLATNQRLKTTSFDLVMSMMLARSESIKRGARVYVMPEANDWTRGWCVVASNTSCSLTTPGDDVVRVFPVPNTLSVAETSASETLVTFSREGRLVGAGGPLVFRVTSTAVDSPRCVTVALTGGASATPCS